MNRAPRFLPALALALCAAATLRGGEWIVRNHRTGWFTVRTDHYQCVLFPGSISPVWFDSPDGHRRIPRHFLLDWIKLESAPDTAIHYLHQDCYAELHVREVDDTRAVVECVGRFCRGRKAFQGVTAHYRYTIFRHSPELLLDGELRWDEGAAPRPCRVNTGVLAWERRPFRHIQCTGAAIQPFRPEGEDAPRSFASDAGLELLEDGMRIGIMGPAQAWNNRRNRHFTYLARKTTEAERRWDGSHPYHFQVRFRIDARGSRR